MGNTGGKALPYTPGDRIPTRFSTSGWQIFDGHSSSDKSSRVTIFKFDKLDPATRAPARPQHVTLASNSLKRLKTLRHPHVLKLLDSLETEEAIMMVCEPVVPLSRWLESSHPDRAGHRGRRGMGDDDDEEERDPAAASKDYQTSLVWGLFCLAEALTFLNSCHLLHGNISPDSVFVTKGGSWKLGGFDLTCALNSPQGDAPDPFLKELDSSGPCPDLYRSPERAALDWSAVAVSRSSACLDAFSVGTLICEAFSGQRGGLQNHEQVKEALSAPRMIPPTLRPLVQKLLSANPKIRPIDFAVQLRASEYFRHPLCDCVCFLDELALKEPAEKQKFFRSLPGLLSNGSIPDHIAKYRLLPALMQALEFGAAGGGGTIVLAPILEIGSRLPPQEYEREIIPCVVRLFASTDRATRVQLLHHLPTYLPRLTDSVINDQILPQLLNGFADTNPVLREATVKSALFLAPRLTEANRYNTLLKQLKKTAGDPEPAIRVNTVICIGRIAFCIHDAAQREDLLTSVFLRAMRDQFPASRAAALKAIAFCVSLPVSSNASAGLVSAKDSNQAPVAQPPAGYWTSEVLAKRVVPAASYLTLDAYGDARDAAFTLLDAAVKLLRSNSETMWVEEKKRAETNALNTAAGGGGASGGDGTSDDSNSANSGGVGSGVLSSKAGKAMSSALGWAVSSLASRIIPSGTIDGQDQPSSSPAAGTGTPVAAAPTPAAAHSAPSYSAGAAAYPTNAAPVAAAAKPPTAMKLSASSSSSSGGGGGGWGDFDDLGLGNDDDDSSSSARKPAPRPAGIASSASASSSSSSSLSSLSMAAAARPSNVSSSAPVSAAAAAPVKRQPTLAEAARASAAAKAATAASAAAADSGPSGWGDGEWGSLLGDESSAPAPAPPRAPAPAPAPVRTASSGAMAATAAATTPSNGSAAGAAAAGGGMKLAAATKKIPTAAKDDWDNW